MFDVLNDMFDALDQLLLDFVSCFDPFSFLGLENNIRGLLAVILVSVICGAVGALVVGNRMAFFSDALAHTAFAGVALGLLLGLLSGTPDEDLLLWTTPVMVIFGIVVGLAIAVVREASGQASDTIIGVFFAAVTGFGALLLKAASTRRILPPEDFLFGNLYTVSLKDLAVLLLLALVTAGVLGWKYNQIVFTSFSPSLARSRQISIRLCSYLLIILLALIVNICLKTVGVLLINALLVVPAAAAANVSRNMRRLFWVSILFCLGAGVGGQWLSWEVKNLAHLNVGEGGMIVLLSVAVFFVSLFVGPFHRKRAWPRPAGGTGLQNP